MATINVKDAAGSTVALEKPLTPGQATMANSRPVVLASDQASVPVAATLAAETTKVIGTVRTASGGIASGSVASGAVASGAYAAGSLAAGAGVDGWDLTQGAIADAAVTAGATGSISAKLRSISRDIVSNIVLAAGTAILGKVGIDQTTDGTTNKVSANLYVGGAVSDKGVGTGGSATARVAIDSSQITTTGTAGSPSSQIVSVQGAASMTPVAQSGYQVTCATDITRPADTTAYTANDTWADSTSSPTSGGFTLTGAARASGGSGIITDIYFLSSAVPGTLLQAEMHIFDSAATAVNDNAAWNLSDADAKLRLAIVPFTLVADANNSYYHAQNLNIGFTCVGTANLRYLIKVKNAYAPTSAEVLTVRAKIIQST